MAGTAAAAQQLEPGPQLHFGMFSKRTVKEVKVLCQQLLAASGDDAILAILAKVEDYPVDSLVLHQTGIGKELAKLKKQGSAQVAAKAEELSSEWRTEFQQRNRVIESFCSKGNLTKKRARELEEGLFNFACPLALLEGEHYRLYQRHFKRLCTHLRTRGAGSLTERLSNGSMEPSSVAFMPDPELLSEAQRHAALAQKDAGLREAILSGQEVLGVESLEYTCPSCGSSHCSHQEMHTAYHSDGQDMTVLVVCLSCNHRWKASDDHGLSG